MSDLPVLVLHGEDDKIVPFPLTAVKAVKLLKNGKLISYRGAPHGMPTTEAATINKDLLAFINYKRLIPVETIFRTSDDGLSNRIGVGGAATRNLVRMTGELCIGLKNSDGYKAHRYILL